MFFKLHKENKIGYKLLTDADLGRKVTSHQTHIGLFDDILTFLPNNIELEDAMVIYNNDIEFMGVNFDRIENPDNTYRSPKIRVGGKNTVSVVSFIRDKVKEYPNDLNWYLFWFGLENEQTVFFIFNESSLIYQDVKSLGFNFDEKKGRLEPKDEVFNSLVNYLENIVNNISDEFIEELEVAAQINEIKSKKYKNFYRTYDIEKAKEIFSRIGKEGEILINNYLALQLKQNRILHYDWKNKDRESGLPYDFSVENLDGEVIYIDVKTTNYGFNQKMVFSSQEINYVENSPCKYSIFRVYKDGEKNCFRICNNTKELFSKINNEFRVLERNLANMAIIETIKVAIPPTHELLSFGDEIEL